MTARIIALLAAVAVMLAVLVVRVMAVSVPAGTVLASVLTGLAVLYAAYRLMATGPGQHVLPRGYAEADERLADTLERVIPRAVTEHAPPWDPAPVIEPAAVTQGPPPRPVTAPGDWVWTAVWSGGRVTELRGAVLPAVDLAAVPAMPGWVADILGHDTTDASVESSYTRALALELREKLADGTS